MLVNLLNFGSNWWARFGREPEDMCGSARHNAYYNSTGVRCGSKMRRHWVMPGLLRFNAVGDFNPDLPERAIGHTFICSDLKYAFGGNRLLFQSKAAKGAVPDCYLLVVSSGAHGRFDFSSSVWKSVLAQVVAASQLRELQEAMLLMKQGDWVQTMTGFWQLSVPNRTQGSPELIRIGAPLSA